jgi:hypothetical protein
MYNVGRPGGAVQVDGARCAGREEILLQQRDPAERLGEAAGANRLPGQHLARTVVDPYVFWTSRIRHYLYGSESFRVNQQEKLEKP